jgi:3-phenylpropionate/cinnamic acid dioxygenase small subunit
MLSAEDHFAITDLINLHGHLTDNGDFDGWPALFAEDVVYDVSAMGGGVLVGISASRDAALAMGDNNPVAHHVTNIVINEVADGTVRALSKGFGVMTDGTVGSATYEDTIQRIGAGWKITHRIVRPRRKPLHP